MEPKPRMVHRSQALFVSGIVAMSLTPVALAIGVVGWLQKESCEQSVANFVFDPIFPMPFPSKAECDRYDGSMYGGLIAAPLLLGGGLAMLLVGVHKVPADTAALRIRPWVSAESAGVGAQTAF